jgi:hypothetical protein
MSDAGEHQDVRVRTILKGEVDECRVPVLDASTEGVVERRELLRAQVSFGRFGAVGLHRVLLKPCLCP